MPGAQPEWLADVARAAPSPIFAVDDGGRIVDANRAAEARVGRRLEEFVGTPLSAVVGGADVHGPELERLLAAGENLVHMGTFELALPSQRAVWSDELYRLHGFAPGEVTPSIELLLERTHPDDRAAVDQLLSRIVGDPGSIPPEGTTAEYRVVLRDGSVRDMRAHGRVDHGPGDARWIGAVQDVTDQRLRERELRAHYAVSQALRDWESFDEGVVDLLRRIGTALEYPMGSLWIWDRSQDALACRAFWHAPDVDPGEFEQEKRRLRFRPGEGKPGEAWATGRPAVTEEMERDPVFRPRDTALRHGLRSAIASPAVGPAGPIAVLSFYSFERRTLSTSLLRTLTGIGGELGRFLHGRRAALEPGPLSPRELEVLRLAAAGNTGPEIAAELVVSLATVKTHLRHIYEKLGVSDRAAAVALALRTGLID
jgi:DNA-binding CsgD family transcriptional regulator/PAS domain-containing protein